MIRERNIDICVNFDGGCLYVSVLNQYELSQEQCSSVFVCYFQNSLQHVLQQPRLGESRSKKQNIHKRILVNCRLYDQQFPVLFTISDYFLLFSVLTSRISMMDFRLSRNCCNSELVDKPRELVNGGTSVGRSRDGGQLNFPRLLER